MNIDERVPSASTATDETLVFQPHEHPDYHGSPDAQRRPHKHRSTGAFLLSNSLLGGDHGLGGGRGGSLRRDKPRKKKTILAPANKPPSREEKSAEQGNKGSRVAGASSRPSKSRLQDGFEGTEDPTAGHSLARAVSPSQAPPLQPLILDVDSAQIVNMALNLSESRRLAARRNISSPLPPRLAPLPDHTTGGSLKQHLQAQRRTTRTVSPKPRPISGLRIPSLPITLEPEGTYRYHFSQSTLARAQKAKEHLELMAQYRRLLEFVPPLNSGSLSRQPTASPPGTSNGAAAPGYSHPFSRELGRPYNPLQFIRNRKVRARERHDMSGETHGFADALKVSDWVDEVAKWAATRHDLTDGSSLPPFIDADIVCDKSDQHEGSSKAVSFNKTKMPRVDWLIDPADMIADIYWLEQDDHKSLIEDRNWERIFPQDPKLSRQNDKPARTSYDRVLPENENPEILPELQLGQVKTTRSLDPEPSHQSTRERARNKLHDIKEKHHHRHSSSISADLLRLRRSSVSDSSDNDSEGRRRRARQGTVSAHSKDALEKQMMKLIAKEARENELDGSLDPKTLLLKPTQHTVASPEKISKKPGLLSRHHSRKDSRLTDHSDVEDKGPWLRSKPSSPLVSARPSLDVPLRPFHRRTDSLDVDSSQPNSPDMRPPRSRRGSGLIPPISLDLSPPTSRAHSPARNPFTKVKKMFRERSRDRSGESYPDDRSGTEEPRESLDRSSNAILSPAIDKKQSFEGHDSLSPVTRLPTRTTGDNQKGHSRIGSLRDVGPKGIFRNPRIDAIIRGSVSKVEDFIWKRPQYNQDEQDDTSSDTSTDDSDIEEAEGRSQDGARAGATGTVDASNSGAKHFLDVTSRSSRDITLGESPSSPPLETSISPSRNRFDSLKPPKIDVFNLSPGGSPPNFPPPRTRDDDLSTTGSRTRPPSYMDGARRTSDHLNAALEIGPPQPVKRPHRLSVQTMQSLPWSVGSMECTAAGTLDRRLPSKKEVARLKTLMLSTGIKAMEISRRAHQTCSLADADNASGTALVRGIKWSEIASLAGGTRDAHRRVTQIQLFRLAARVLRSSIETSENQWQAEAQAFATKSMPQIHQRIDDIRERVSDSLLVMAREAADDADGIGKDLVVGQIMKVKLVNEVMDKMLRRGRRRFRWLRRAGWLAVEWVLVGFMWYVWFMVTVLRIALGVVRGVGRGVKWLLWL